MNTITARPVDAVIAAAREFLGERLSTAQAVREQHGRGEDQTPPTLPDAVAFAETTEEVSRIVALCHQHGVAVTPFGMEELARFHTLLGPLLRVPLGGYLAY